VATHKPLVHIDLSGWSPKYFPPQLIQYANTLLQDKVLFGSDYPLITPDRWLADFDALPIKPGVRPKILKDNAVRLLGLAPGRERATTARSQRSLHGSCDRFRLRTPPAVVRCHSATWASVSTLIRQVRLTQPAPLVRGDRHRDGVAAVVSLAVRPAVVAAEVWRAHAVTAAARLSAV
jgi:hypothetical protein